jgi:hypothetical protein
VEVCWLAEVASLLFVQHYLVCQPSTVADYGERLNKNTKKFRSGRDKHCNTWSCAVHVQQELVRARAGR